MPAKAVKRGDKWRVVEDSNGELVRRNGSPVDGGGHETKKQAREQAQAINASS